MPAVRLEMIVAPSARPVVALAHRPAASKTTGSVTRPIVTATGVTAVTAIALAARTTVTAT